MRSIILSLISILIFVGCAKTTLNSTIDNNNANEEVKEEVANFEEEVKKLEAECNNGNADSCYFLANKYSNGNGVAEYLIKAFELREKACNLGDMGSCGVAGLGYFYGIEDDIQQDLNKALPYLEKGCNSEFAIGCGALANMYFNGVIVKKDIKKAYNYYEKSCNSSFEFDREDSCDILAVEYLHGENVTQNIEKALEFKEKSCSKNKESDMCNNEIFLYYGVALYYGNDELKIKKDVSKAKIIFEELCAVAINGDINKREPSACGVLGDMYYHGNGVEKNYRIARTAFEYACAPFGDLITGRGVSCTKLGAMYFDGLGVRQDFKKAYYYLGLGCDDGVPPACNLYNEMQRNKYLFGIDE